MRVRERQREIEGERERARARESKGIAVQGFALSVLGVKVQGSGFRVKGVGCGAWGVGLHPLSPALVHLARHLREAPRERCGMCQQQQESSREPRSRPVSGFAV